MRRPIEELLEDETITEMLPDGEASLLLGWLISLAEEEGELDSETIGHLKLLGRKVARISSLWGVPVSELVDLVETAWEEPGDPSGSEPEPVRA